MQDLTPSFAGIADRFCKPLSVASALFTFIAGPKKLILVPLKLPFALGWFAIESIALPIVRKFGYGLQSSEVGNLVQ